MNLMIRLTGFLLVSLIFAKDGYSFLGFDDLTCTESLGNKTTMEVLKVEGSEEPNKDIDKKIKTIDQCLNKGYKHPKFVKALNMKNERFCRRFVVFSGKKPVRYERLTKVQRLQIRRNSKLYNACAKLIENNKIHKDNEKTKYLAESNAASEKIRQDSEKSRERLLDAKKVARAAGEENKWGDSKKEGIEGEGEGEGEEGDNERRLALPPTDTDFDEVD